MLGCAAVILAGRTSGALSLHRLVDWAPVQWTGNVSYSLYLWHWPLLVFATHVMGRDPRPLESVGLLALSLLLAAASHRWVETPARRFRPLAVSSLRALAAGSVAVVLVAGLAVTPVVGQSRLLERERAAATALVADPPAGFGAASIDDGAGPYLAASRQIVPIPAEAGSDLPQLGNCVQAPDAGSTRECEFGDPHGKTTVALVGDSHATQWYQAIDAMAREHGWKLVTYLKNSCPFTSSTRWAEAQGNIKCTGANRATLERILAARGHRRGGRGQLVGGDVHRAGRGGLRRLLGPAGGCRHPGVPDQGHPAAGPRGVRARLRGRETR